MTRRALLLTAVAAPAATAEEPNIRWALGAVTWVVKARPRSPDWADILADIQAGGFQGFEPYTTPTLPVNDENIERLERLAPKAGLRLSGIYWGDQWHLPSERSRQLGPDARRFLGYLKRFGSDRLILGPPRPDVEEEQQAIAEMAKTVNELGRLARDEYGVKVAVHPHVSGLIENPRQIDQLMEETDPALFHFAPDTAQLYMGGAHPVRFIEKHKRRLAYLHYKDIRAYHRGLPGYLDNVIELGRGVIDFPAIHRILKSISYRGWIAIDLDNARTSPLESARINRAYIDRFLSPIYR